MLITLPFYNHWLASQIGKYVFTLSTVWSMEYVQQQLFIQPTVGQNCISLLASSDYV